MIQYADEEEDNYHHRHQYRAGDHAVPISAHHRLVECFGEIRARTGLRRDAAGTN